MGKAEKTKEYIVEQVASIFNRKGYAATSLKDLTEVTGLTKGAIYGNFKNKDDVAVHAFLHNAGFVNEQLLKNLKVSANSRDKLAAYPRTFREIYPYILSTGGCPILNTAVDSSELHDALQDAVQKVIEKWNRTIVSIISEGVEKGEFSPGCDAGKTARIIICLVEGGYAMSKVTGESSYIESSLEQVESLISTL